MDLTRRKIQRMVRGNVSTASTSSSSSSSSSVPSQLDNIESINGVVLFDENKVGINVASPEADLHVSGNIKTDADVEATGKVSATGNVETEAKLAAFGNVECGGNVIAGAAAGTYIQIGPIRIVYDESNDSLVIIKSDGSAANLEVTGTINGL